MGKKNIVIIPARGGSKRLPDKNTKMFGGVPLIVHSINFAKANLDIIDTVVVSTDDENIKEIALNNGVYVINRPEHLATDTATTVSVLKHALLSIEEEFETIILLQPTNPLRPKNLLKEAYDIYATGFDSLITVSTSKKKLGKIERYKFRPVNYAMGQRSQELEPLFFENGLIYLSSCQNILNDKIIGDNNYAMIIDHPFGHVDIDDQMDFRYAEFLLKAFRNEEF